MHLSTPEQILPTSFDLAESPTWDTFTQRLYWIDIHAGTLHSYDPQDGAYSAYPVGETVGCAVPFQAETLALAIRHGFALFDLASNRLTRLVELETGMTNNRFNDGKCDPAGRFLAGSMDIAEQHPNGSLYSLDTHGQATSILGGLRVSNGLAWSPDGRTFYHADTPTCKVMAYDYDPDTGQLANPRLAVRAALPDGMTTDRQGRLWIAHWRGAAVTVWNPESSQLIEKISLPAYNVTSCIFGGPDLTDLYITTARHGLDAATLAAYPLSGAVFRIRTNVEGMPTDRYRWAERTSHPT